MPIETSSASWNSNFFFILGATTRDNRLKIQQLAEDKGLFLDEGLCSKAMADLTNPRSRLSSEIAWFPGISPRHAEQLLATLEIDAKSIQDLNLDGLVYANLLASGLSSFTADDDVEHWVQWITELAYTNDSIEPDVVMRDINEDRAVAGFPEVKSLNIVEEELLARRSYYKGNIIEAINSLPTLIMVDIVTNLVDETTNSGEVSAPTLVYDIIDYYEISVHSFLEKEASNISTLAQQIRTIAHNGESNTKPVINKLDSVLRNWNKFAQPIQLSMKSRGHDHDMSCSIAYDIRSLAIDLCNEHNMLDTAKHVTLLLQEVFAELPEVAEKLDDDTDAIDSIIDSRNKRENEHEAWKRDITYSAELGLIFKDKLSISPEFVAYNNKRIPLDAVTKVRYGSINHYLNGLPSKTVSYIYVGNKEISFSVKTENYTVFSQYTSRLWRAVCVNLLIALIKELKNGAKYKFGDALIDDCGAEVTSHKFFRTERVYAKWNKLRAWNSSGNFLIGIDGEHSIKFSQMSYIEDNNVHIISRAVDILYEKNCSRLSQIFD